MPRRGVCDEGRHGIPVTELVERGGWRHGVGKARLRLGAGFVNPDPDPNPNPNPNPNTHPSPSPNPTPNLVSEHVAHCDAALAPRAESGPVQRHRVV